MEIVVSDIKILLKNVDCDDVNDVRQALDKLGIKYELLKSDMPLPEWEPVEKV